LLRGALARGGALSAALAAARGGPLTVRRDAHGTVTRVASRPAKVWLEVRKLGDATNFEKLFVVKLHNHSLLAPPQPLFEFAHPRARAAELSYNERCATLRYRSAIGGLCHGFAGYFNCELFKELSATPPRADGARAAAADGAAAAQAIVISTEPSTRSAGMGSWFEAFLPLQVCCAAAAGVARARDGQPSSPPRRSRPHAPAACAHTAADLRCRTTAPRVCTPRVRTRASWRAPSAAPDRVACRWRGRRHRLAARRRAGAARVVRVGGVRANQEPRLQPERALLLDWALDAHAGARARARR
jgi:hypothetical protein